MRKSARCLMAVLASLVAASAQAQAQAGRESAPGVLVVTVRESDTGALLSNVRITAIRAGSQSPVTGRTTDDGTARLMLPPGDYRIDAQAEEHLTGRHSVGLTMSLPRRPPSSAEGVVDEPGIATLAIYRGGNHRISFALPRASSIQGFVSGENGRTLSDVDVELLRAVGSAGNPLMSRWTSAKTDATGHFRITGIRPGDYYVRVRFGSPVRPAHNDVYYPGVSELAAATPVTIGSAHDASLSITTPLLPLGSISGIVTGPAAILSRVELVYQRLGEDTGCVTVMTRVPVGEDGGFAVSGLMSGRYSLRAEARAAGDETPRYGAVRIVDVGTSPVVDVNIQLQAYAALRGRFEFHGTSPKPTLFHPADVVAVGPDSVGRDGPSSRYVELPSPDGFGVDGILGLNRLYVSAPDGWIVESAVLADGTDIYNTPYAFEPGKQYADVRIVLSDRTASLKGRVLLERGDTPPSQGMAIAAFPDDQAAGTPDPSAVVHGSVQDDGSFLIPDVKPGRAYLVAEYPWQSRTGDAAWYAALARVAARIDIATPGIYLLDVRLAR